MEILSRDDAYAAGKTRYFTGEVCRNGHLAERYVTQGACVDCLKKFRKFAPNAYTKRLVPWQPQLVYVPRGLTTEQELELKDFVRQCVTHWSEQKGLMDDESRAAQAKREAWIHERRAEGRVFT